MPRARKGLNGKCAEKSPALFPKLILRCFRNEKLPKPAWLLADE
jgi:hypothetical protein